MSELSCGSISFEVIATASPFLTNQGISSLILPRKVLRKIILQFTGYRQNYTGHYYKILNSLSLYIITHSVVSLTLCVPEEAEQAGAHEPLWNEVHSNMKFQVVDHLELKALEEHTHTCTHTHHLSTDQNNIQMINVIIIPSWGKNKGVNNRKSTL